MYGRMSNSELWDVLLQTENSNDFVLTVWATSEQGAKSKAKRLSKGCKVIGCCERRASGVYLT